MATRGGRGLRDRGAGEFGIAGGLTCVLAGELSRAGVWEALCRRRCYGTTGARILLDVQIAGALMGAVVTEVDSVDIRARVVGAAPLEVLQVYRGRELLAEVQPPEFRDLGDSNRMRLMWSGSRMRGRGRRVDWSGVIRTTQATIVEATTVSFDSAADGITATEPQAVAFQSQTTGDCDGIELVLDGGRVGRLVFESVAGTTEIDLAGLRDEPLRFDYGGLDMQLVVRRYPERVDALELTLETVDSAAGGGAGRLFRQSYSVRWGDGVVESGVCVSPLVGKPVLAPRLWPRRLQSQAQTSRYPPSDCFLIPTRSQQDYTGVNAVGAPCFGPSLSAHRIPALLPLAGLRCACRSIPYRGRNKPRVRR